MKKNLLVCDRCTEQMVLATARVTVKDVVVDLCVGHVEELRNLVKDWMRGGQKTGPRRKLRYKAGEHQCDQCSKGFSTKVGLGNHRRKTHGIVSMTKGAIYQRALQEKKKAQAKKKAPTKAAA